MQENSSHKWKNSEHDNSLRKIESDLDLKDNHKVNREPHGFFLVGSNTDDVKDLESWKVGQLGEAKVYLFKVLRIDLKLPKVQA